VIDALARVNSEVAEWYRGAVIVLAGDGNPERFQQAAHSLREVMNAVGRLAGLPQATEERLGDRFAQMVKAWERGQRLSTCYADGVWRGEIDEPARSALVAVEQVIAWNVESRRTRRDVFLDAARKLDGSDRRLPEVAETAMWREWDRLKSYFNGVSKHSKKTTEEEFTVRVADLERFILQLVRRDVYAEQKEIAALVEEAERGA
jgi:hypothetical protein